MKKYLEVFKLSFKMQIVWRFDVIMTVAAVIARILTAYLIWGVVYGNVETVAGMTYQAMLSYYLVSSIIKSLDKSRGVSNEISYVIRSGRFSGHMVVPMNPMAYFGSMVLGEAAFPCAFSLIAAVACAFIMKIDVLITMNISAIVLGLSMAILGLLFMIVFQYILGILAFKFISVRSIIFIANHLFWFLTGATIPLALFPDWAQYIMSYLPFYYVNYMPAMLLTGGTTTGVYTGIVILMAWTAAMMLVGNTMYTRLRVSYDGVGI